MQKVVIPLLVHKNRKARLQRRKSLPQKVSHHRKNLIKVLRQRNQLQVNLNQRKNMIHTIAADIKMLIALLKITMKSFTITKTMKTMMMLTMVQLITGMI